MKPSHLTCVAVAWVALAGWGAAFAADAGKTDVLKDKGLTKAGNTLVLADEAAVLDGMKALRAAKAEADKEVRLRTAIDLQIAAKQKAMRDAEKTWGELEARLPSIQREDVKNNIILRMNRLVTEQKQAVVALKDFETQATKLSSTGQTKYVDALVPLNAKAAAAATKYAALANDADVKAAAAKASAITGPKVALGPTPEFAAAAEELKKWQGAVESEAIPVREHGGIFAADVLLNGEQFAMGVDTGASTIALPAEVAVKLKLVADEKTPTVQMKLANGAIIEGKEMSLKTVRVGRFTVENVTCVVLEAGLPDPPLLLGNSFLNHFVVSLDASKHELHLTEVKQASSTPAKAAPAKSGNAGTPAADK